MSHVQEWRQQFQKLESVNLRYDNQVIVNPDLVNSGMKGKPHPVALAPAAAKAAVAAGVKPAALITRVGPHDKPLPKPAFELTEKKLDPKSAATKKPAPRPRIKRTAKSGKGGPPKKVAAKPSASAPKAVAATTHVTSQKPQAKKPPQAATSAAFHPSVPKPSPAIAKQQGSTSPN